MANVGRITPARHRVDPPSIHRLGQESSYPSRGVVQLRLRYHNPTRQRGTTVPIASDPSLTQRVGILFRKFLRC